MINAPYAMDPLYTLVASGDPASREHLACRLNAFPGVAVVDVCDTALGLTRALRTRAVHLLVLHAHLPPDGGEAALSRLGADAPPAVVVAEADPGDGLWAYTHGAVDCLPAASGDDRFCAAITRARDRILDTEIRAHRDRLLALLRGVGIVPAVVADPPVRPLVVRSGSQLIFLDPSEIDWVEASGVYVSVHVGGTKHLLRETLRHVEEQLDPTRFVRIHRSTILNVERVRKITPHFNGGAVVVLKDGTQLKMSRSYRERISVSLG